MPLSYSKGELVDRYAIEIRKSQYGAQNGKFLLDLVAAIREHQWSANDIMDVIENAMANDSIAVLEWQLRADHKLSNEEVGLRAREIRRINTRRVAAKASIDQTPAAFVPAFDIPTEKLTLPVQEPVQEQESPDVASRTSGSS